MGTRIQNSTADDNHGNMFQNIWYPEYTIWLIFTRGRRLYLSNWYSVSRDVLNIMSSKFEYYKVTAMVPDTVCCS